MSLEENMVELNNTIKELIKRFDANMKFVPAAEPTFIQRTLEDAIEEAVKEVKDEPIKKQRKTKASIEQPIVVDVPVGDLDGEEDEQEEIVADIPVEVIASSPVKKETSLEELQSLAQKLIAKDGGNTTRAKEIIVKYADKISMFTPEQRNDAAFDLEKALNG